MYLVLETARSYCCVFPFSAARVRYRQLIQLGLRGKFSCTSNYRPISEQSNKSTRTSMNSTPLTPLWTTSPNDVVENNHSERPDGQQPTHTAVNNNPLLTTWWTTTLSHRGGQKLSHTPLNNSQAKRPIALVYLGCRRLREG